MRKYVIDIDFSKTNVINNIETIEQDFYPVFFYDNENPNFVTLWYGNKEIQHSEYLTIDIDLLQKTLIMDRDLKGTLILFYYFQDSRLIISSDYTYFSEHLNWITINLSYVNILLGSGQWVDGTILNDVHIAYPWKRYEFTPKWCTIHKKEFLAQEIDLQDIIHQQFCCMNSNNIIWAELSWWKDSAFLPILSKKSNNFPFRFASWQLHNGSTGNIQRNTLSWIINFLDIPFEFHTISDKDYPLKKEVPWAIDHPIQEIYKNSLLEEIAIFKKHGINTVFTGFWGDEMFEKFSKNNNTQPVNCKYESIFTKSFLESTLWKHNTINQRDNFPPSLYQALISRNNLYIHNGIWPVSPFQNIDIYGYFQKLYLNKKDFFKYFYGSVDPDIAVLFEKNTNMVEYFSEYIRSDYFNSLLLSCLCDKNSIISYYNTNFIHTHLFPTKIRNNNQIKVYGFHVYLFVKLSLMLNKNLIPRAQNKDQ